MEPADQRRDDSGGLVAGLEVLLLAAMEPADQRRDDPRTACSTSSGRRQPQWSPPASGGTTTPYMNEWSVARPPQWSPPTNGGTTRGPCVAQMVHEVAAMEPAYQRRDDIMLAAGVGYVALPQWSPPTSGRTT